MDLESKTVVILGGGNGIGRAGALAIAAAGAQVVIGDVDESSAAETANLVAIGGGRAVGARADITNTRELEDLRDLALATFGSIDLMWCHAGKAIAGALEDIPLADWSRLLDINCLGPVRAFSVFGKLFIGQGHGHIVLTSSSLALFPEQLPEAAPYVLTKSAVQGFGRALTAYLRPRGVGVTLLVPDATNTDHATQLPVIGMDEAAFRSNLDPAAMDAPEEVAKALVEGLRDEEAVIALTPDARERFYRNEEEFWGDLPSTSGTVVAEGLLQVEPSDHDALLSEIRQLTSLTRSEPGNLAYRWTIDPDQAGHFYLFEEWESAAALERHAQSAHGQAFITTLKTLSFFASDLRIRLSSPPQALQLPD